MKKNLFVLTTILMSLCCIFTSCEDDEATSNLPKFKELTLSSSTYAPGETVKATLTFADAGSYIKGTYGYSTSPASKDASGSFELGPVDSHEFKFNAPEEPGKYTLTVQPSRMAAYAGNKPYIEYSSMGSVSTTFTVK
ncbi:MAG: hypothetical protein KBT29_07295 [Prevotellaceae bacterium]|nr:hypothetical protein [Candidatus Minthosoma caballi]